MFFTCQIFKFSSLPRIPEFTQTDRIKTSSGKQRWSFKEKEERSERKQSGCLSQEKQKSIFSVLVYSGYIDFLNASDTASIQTCQKFCNTND